MHISSGQGRVKPLAGHYQVHRRLNPAAASSGNDLVMHKMKPDDGGNRIGIEVAADGITDHLSQLIQRVRLGENRVPEGAMPQVSRFRDLGGYAENSQISNPARPGAPCEAALR